MTIALARPEKYLEMKVERTERWAWCVGLCASGMERGEPERRRVMLGWVRVNGAVWTDATGIGGEGGAGVRVVLELG